MYLQPEHRVNYSKQRQNTDGTERLTDSDGKKSVEEKNAANNKC